VKERRGSIYTNLDIKDFYSAVYINFDYNYDCENNKCNKICRCGEIVNSKIEDCNVSNFASLCKKYIKGKKDEIKFYCLERFLNEMVKKNPLGKIFKIGTCGGYYGEEVEGVYLTSFAQKEVGIFIEQLNKKSHTELIEIVLEKEYGYILPQIKNKQWHIDKFLLSDIDISFEHKFNIDKINEYKSRNLSCLCRKINEKYRLIDGRHRYIAAINANKKKILTIWCQ
jgi:hypothetical protein